MSAAMGSQRWLFVEEVEQLYGYPTSTLYYWRKIRKGPPAYRIGRRLQYKPCEIEAWRDQQADKDEIAKAIKHR